MTFLELKYNPVKFFMISCCPTNYICSTEYIADAFAGVNFVFLTFTTALNSLWCILLLFVLHNFVSLKTVTQMFNTRRKIYWHTYWGWRLSHLIRFYEHLHAFENSFVSTYTYGHIISRKMVTLTRLQLVTLLTLLCSLGPWTNSVSYVGLKLVSLCEKCMEFINIYVILIDIIVLWGKHA